MKVWQNLMRMNWEYFKLKTNSIVKYPNFISSILILVIKLWPEQFLRDLQGHHSKDELKSALTTPM